MAIYACEKATQLGAKVVTMSDSNGYVYDPNGIDLAYVKDLKEVRRGRIKEYGLALEAVVAHALQSFSGEVAQAVVGSLGTGQSCLLYTSP